MHFLPPEEKTGFDHFKKTHQNVFGVHDNKSLFIDLTWVIPMKQKLFHHFSKVIFIDTLNQTNKHKPPLSTISEKDTHGKMFIILRAFLLNERAWVFCWLFQPYFLLMFYLK